MQQIYEYNVFPVVQDQIRYDGETNPPKVVARQLGCPKTKCLWNQSFSLTQKSPQSSALSVEREDKTIEHAPMCHCDVR